MRSIAGSRAVPVERDVLARIDRPLEPEAERVDRANCRFAPGHDVAGAGLRTGRVDQLRIFAGQAGRAADRIGPGLDLAGDLGAPAGPVGRDLEGDPGALDAADLPALREHAAPERREPADLAAENS